MGCLLQKPKISSSRSTSPAGRVHSSKPAVVACGGWMEQTDRQTDARQQHKPCSTYRAGSVNKSQVFTLRSSNFSVKSMILANWWNSACCDSRCWRAVMSLEHSMLSRFGTVLSAQRAMTMTSISFSEAKYLYAHLSH